MDYDPISILENVGYTEREAAFLYLVARHSGYFLHVEEGAEFAVTEGSTISLPGFLEHLVGLERGGPHEFSFQLPEDFQATELAGKTASYTVYVHEVKQQVLPDLDDDFARSLDEGFESVAELRERVETNVRARAQSEVESSYREELVDLLVAGAELDYPEVIVEREVDRLLDQQSDHASHTREELDRWLQQVGQTEEEVRDSLRPRADLLVRRALVLGELADRESIEVSQEQVQAEVDRTLEQFGIAGLDEEQRESFRSMLDTPERHASILNQLLTSATLERLVEIASQAEDAEETPRVRGSRRRRRSGEEETTMEDQREQQSEGAEQDPLEYPAGDTATDPESAAGADFTPESGEAPTSPAPRESESQTTNE